MDRGAWPAPVRGVVRVRHDLVTKTHTHIDPLMSSLADVNYF